MTLRRVLVTGATGFFGRHICKALLAAGYEVTVAVRRFDSAAIDPDIKIINVGEIGPGTNWEKALDGVEVIIHAAARTHVFGERPDVSEKAYRSINFEATKALATQAAESGVQQFIFISSVKAGGEFSKPGWPLRAEAPPAPEDAYGRTKLEAEKFLVDMACMAHMDIMILRAPLIYGPGLRGNMLSLFKAVSKGIILPFKGINNRRDLIYVLNLVDATMCAIRHKKFPKHIYYVCDADAVSTAELVHQISSALNRPARLFFLPIFILKILGCIIGYSHGIRKLTETLEVDGTEFCKDAEWAPPFSMKEGLASTAAWFKSHSIK